MRPVPEAARALVMRWEGLHLEAYADPATGGAPWTIGYGHTRDVTPGQKISAERAALLLSDDLAEAAAALERKIGAGVVAELTDNQYAALISFVFNLGTGSPLRREWTIWKRLRARQFDQAPGELIKFVNAGGKKLQGLVNRRTDEIRVWSTDEPGSEDVHLTSGVTRFVATPPTPADPTPAHRSATIWAAVCAGVGGALKWLSDLAAQIPDFAHTALNAINPFAEHSPIAQAIVNGLGGVAAAAGLYVAWSVTMKKRENRS